VWAQLSPQRAAELLDRGLGHRVGGGERAGHERVQRADQQDVAAPLDDVGQGGAHGVPAAEHVDGEHALEDGVVAGEHAGGGRLDAGVGDHHVEAAGAVAQLADGRLDRGAIRDVRHRPGRAQLGGPALQLGAVEVDQRGTGAARGERPRRGETDASGGPGDEHGAAREVVAAHRRASASAAAAARSSSASRRCCSRSLSSRARMKR
jgi:hypothetical protein